MTYLHKAIYTAVAVRVSKFFFNKHQHNDSYNKNLHDTVHLQELFSNYEKNK